MNKNKKLISLVSAIAMIFTMLSSFTYANAAGEGLKLSTPVLSADGKTATVEIQYENIANGVALGEIKIDMPKEVTKVEANPSATVVDLRNGVFSYNFALGATADATKTSGTLTTLTLTLSDGLAAPEAIKIKDDSFIGSGDNTAYTIGDNLATNEVEIPADPNAPTPKPVTTAKPAPVATDEPASTDKPVINPPVTAEMGLNFGTPVVSEDGLTVKVTIDYKDIANGIALGELKIDMPKEVTKVEANPSATVVDLRNGVFSYNFALGATADATKTSGTLTELTLTLSEPLKYDNQLTFKDDSFIGSGDNTAYTVGSGEGTGIIKPSNVVIPAFAGNTPEKTTYDLAMQKAVGDKVDVSDDVLDANGDSKYWVKVEVKKADKTEAVYGTDFVAAIGDAELTKAQYQNAMNGHLSALPASLGITSMKDLIEKLTFKLYDNAMTVTAPVVELATGEILNAEVGEVSTTPAKPTPTPAPASMTLKSDLGSIPVSGTAKLTATVVDLKDATPGTDVTFVIKSGADKVELMDADANGEVTKTLTVVKDKNGDATDERAASAYVRGKKTGKAVVEATYTYTGKDGKPAEVKKTVNVTVAAASTGGNGGSSDDDKTGSTGSLIAGGWNGSSNLGGLLSFSDLDSADWAKQAIAALALKGVVSGYGDGTFRPNANITRAEYCQILIGAIDKTSEYADSAYADVPSDAWFYHAVSVANANGIVSGYGDGNFGPYDLITRQDMALMTYKAAQVMNKNLSASRSMSFADAGEISEYAATAVQTLADAGIINGVSDTTFAPRDNATRAQAAKILYDTFVAVK